MSGRWVRRPRPAFPGPAGVLWLGWSDRATAGRTAILMGTDEAQQGDITRFLADAAGGDEAASNRVWSALYDELKRLAGVRLHAERSGHTLSPTALVHEAYVKLVGGTPVAASDRQHFLAVAARAMRQILVDHARLKARVKRGGGNRPVTLDEERDGVTHPDTDPEVLLALDEALTRLEDERERLARVVELRFFGGLSTPETAELLGVNRRTVERDWSLARAYLYRSLTDDSTEGVP